MVMVVSSKARTKTSVRLPQSEEVAIGYSEGANA
jgi:hypothetical protein